MLKSHCKRQNKAAEKKCYCEGNHRLQPCCYSLTCHYTIAETVDTYITNTLGTPRVLTPLTIRSKLSWGGARAPSPVHIGKDEAQKWEMASVTWGANSRGRTEPSASRTFSSAQHRVTLFLKSLNYLWGLLGHSLASWRSTNSRPGNNQPVPRPFPCFPPCCRDVPVPLQHFGASSGVLWAGCKDAEICWANHCPSLPLNPDKLHPKHRVNMCW